MSRRIETISSIVEAMNGAFTARDILMEFQKIDARHTPTAREISALLRFVPNIERLGVANVDTKRIVNGRSILESQPYQHYRRRKDGKA